jgi:hypothetical protein
VPGTLTNQMRIELRGWWSPFRSGHNPSFLKTLNESEADAGDPQGFELLSEPLRRRTLKRDERTVREAQVTPGLGDGLAPRTSLYLDGDQPSRERPEGRARAPSARIPLDVASLLESWQHRFP